MDIAAQTADTRPETAPRAVTPGAPQLRTLLLTDLVDSTGLIERLGDGPASDLFRAHDRVVLQLQQQWRGRLIDRSDGLLLLFERPIDGLGFALDYVRELTGLGNERGIKLQARAGLHVGEVLTWRNSDEAVSVGAKPLEVEGLAKPMAARLMALARPGQILLSAVAEPLAHRAARELGERGQHLLWKSYGHWRFKGVPEAQQIFEVGEPGVAPLRMPANSPKAWRDIPLWRRPAALAAELALVACAASALWFATRPAPAIAFNERDWVVIGDLRNLTGQTALDDSLEQAFRISLEQSRHVNVLSDLKARDTLGRMKRPADTVLDRAIASEIALRDGARAVILPTVAEVGGRVRVSAEIIDPRTQTTVFAESVDGVGVDSVLGSIDTVTAQLRGNLGEALASVQTDSHPLPEVTTANLDALRAYALAQKSYSRREYAQALQLYRRATKLDPEFALAWLGQMRVHYANVNKPAAVSALRQAQALRAHLPPREALYLEAWAADFDAPAQALGKWTELATLFPDYWPASGNAATGLYDQNRFNEALVFARRNARPQNDLAANGYDMLGRIHLARGEYEAAAQALDEAFTRGYDSSLRRRMVVEAAQRRFDVAARYMHRLSVNDEHTYLERTSVWVDQGQWAKAREAARTGLTLARKESLDSRYFRLPLAVTDWLAGDLAAARAGVREAATLALDALAQDYDPDAKDDATLALSAAILGLRLGDGETAARVLDALAKQKVLMAIPSLSEMRTVVRAEQARIAGRPAESIAMLRPFLTGFERFQTRVALREAYAANGNPAAAIEQAQWLQSNRARAYMELDCGYCLQALNVADSTLAVLREAELQQAAGQTASARKALAAFDGSWPSAGLPDHLRTRRSALRPESN